VHAAAGGSPTFLSARIFAASCVRANTSVRQDSAFLGFFVFEGSSWESKFAAGCATVSWG
jgi:hypothetical protein